jgi:archaellum biogenesis ATPase FlaH
MNSEKEIEKETQEILKEIEVEEKDKPIHISELMNIQFPDVEWVVEQLIPSESIVAISGAPASFKTWLILTLALKVASGDILFDKFATNQTGVLLIDEENGGRLLQKRFSKIQKNFDLPIYTLSLKDFKLSEDSVDKLIQFAKDKDVKLIIFDSLVRIHAVDENDAIKMAGVFNWLKKFNKEGMTVIFTHHNRKQNAIRSNPSQDMRGSSDILASVDCHLAIERKHKEEILTVTQTKLRQGEETRPFKLNIINDDSEFKLKFAGEVDEIQDKKSDTKEAIKEILEQTNEPMFKKELYETVKSAGVEVGYSTFNTAAKEMVEKNKLFEKKGEKNKIFCSLVPFDQENEPVTEGLF